MRDHGPPNVPVRYLHTVAGDGNASINFMLTMVDRIVLTRMYGVEESRENWLTQVHVQGWLLQTSKRVNLPRNG